jgi:glycogen phosphorylase
LNAFRQALYAARMPVTPSIRRFTVSPSVPPALSKLRALAYNLWWSWAPEAQELFVRMDKDLWEEVYGNPIELLARLGQARLEVLGADEAFVSHVERAHESLERYMSETGWFGRQFPEKKDARIGYFSMEYGLHESLPIYSGGLGVLAGDHLKTASDLGLPLVGIGLAYAEGYFRQQLADDGWQNELYPANDWQRLPVEPVFEANTHAADANKRLLINVQYPDRIVSAQLWRVQVGRIPLYLLDANLECNAPEDRAITGSLYGGDSEFRIRQEIMLGIGGIHALEALGLSPTVCHMNEGHSAFLALERIRRVMHSKGAAFETARLACAGGNVFTTHTPVPAGNDAFKNDVLLRYLAPYREALGLSEQALLDLGSVASGSPTFSMPVLAIHTSDKRNGVSELHGHVSRQMWKDLWPEVPAEEVPLGSITNGVHIASWVSDDLSALYTRYLGPDWRRRTDEPALWARIKEIPDAELWSTHGHRRHRLVALCRKRLRLSAERRGASQTELEAAGEVLDPRALTIGFARRFATYKRATLIFSDIPRLLALLGSTERPVQFVFSGKAHPQDREGKEFIRTIVKLSRDPRFKGKVVFIENYDMRVARALVSGVDIWLNNPRRPLEASGTSGMKAAANGALNVSILDGWWAEAWTKFGAQVGWAIGNGTDAHDEAGDKLEAEALYDLLEREIVPMFFDRNEDRLPRAWIQKMKGAISLCVPEFNTRRMVKNYTEQMYIPSLERTMKLQERDFADAKTLAAWKQSVAQQWPGVTLGDLELSATALEVGQKLKVSATVSGIAASEVAVEVYYGPTGGGHAISTGTIESMQFARTENGAHRFETELVTKESGSQALSVRVRPMNALLSDKFGAGLLRWA